MRIFACLLVIVGALSMSVFGCCLALGSVTGSLAENAVSSASFLGFGFGVAGFIGLIVSCLVIAENAE